MQLFPTLCSFGAAQKVTGSKHLITTVTGEKILLDCGLFQGEGKDSDALNRHWGFEPREIDYVILSHAHIDHTGLLPKLVKDGFTGPIFCNSGTKDLCEIMLLDGAFIQKSDLERINRRRRERHELPIEALYDESDVYQTLEQMVVVANGRPFKVGETTWATYILNAHILGSAAIHLQLASLESKNIHFTFTGDIGRDSDQILDGPFPFPQSDYILCESTYGDRLHSVAEDVKDQLLKIVQETCVDRGGKVIIPAFSVDRTQELIYLLDQLSHEKLLPSIPVYIDSPLSIKATNIMAKHQEEFNPEILKYIMKDGDPFDFPNLHYTSKLEDSKAINSLQGPAIIISASGMAEAGRIKHHIANNIENPNNTILIVGYATPHTLAGQLIQGRNEVRIFGDFFQVNARVERMGNFSAHADYLEMLDFLGCQDAPKVKKVLLVHGNPDVMDVFADKIKAQGFPKVQKMVWGEPIELN